MLFKLMEGVLAMLILLVFLSQIVWPVIKGRPTFPFFRKQRELEKNLADANQAKFEAILQKKVEKNQPHQPGKKE